MIQINNTVTVTCCTSMGVAKVAQARSHITATGMCDHYYSQFGGVCLCVFPSIERPGFLSVGEWIGATAGHGCMPTLTLHEHPTG